MKVTLAFASVVIGALISWQGTGWMAANAFQTHVSAADEKLIPTIEGRALYRAYCASCHGLDAKGGGPVAKDLKVPPADLTRISSRSGGKFSIPRISAIISGEIILDSGHGNREMPVWGPTFSHVDADQDLGRVRIDNLARYLRDIQVK